MNDEPFSSTANSCPSSEFAWLTTKYLRPFSDSFRLKVDGEAVPVFQFFNKICDMDSSDFIYSYYAQKRSKVNFSQFDVTGCATITVSCAFDIESYRILPTPFRIASEINEKEITVHITDTRKFLIEFNGDPENCLMLFPDLPDTNIPKDDAPGVLKFCTGKTHNIGNGYVVTPDIHEIYIERGAVVVGDFAADVHHNESLIIRGRGILYNGDKGWQSDENAVRAQYLDHLEILDVMMIGPSNHTIRMLDIPSPTVKNVKIVGPYWWNSDGVQLLQCEGGVVDSCFIYTQDDSICLYRKHTATNNVVANLDNGCAIAVDFWSVYPSHTVRVEDLYIIYGQHCGEQAAIEVLNYNQYYCNDITFKNIHAENINEGSFIRIMQNKRGCDKDIFLGYTPGRTRDVLFEDVYIYDNAGGLIQGYDENHNVSDVYFNNVKIKKNGKFEIAHSLDDLNLKTSGTVSNIYFNKPYAAIIGDELAFITNGDSKTFELSAGTISGITKTEFYLDGALYKECTNGELGFVVDSIKPGQHTVYAVVTANGEVIKTREHTCFVKESDQLLMNGDFKYDTSYWYPSRESSVAMKIETGTGHDDKNAVKISGRTDSAEGIYQSIAAQLQGWYYATNPDDGNYRVTFTAWVKNETVQSKVRFNIYYYNWSSVRDDPQKIFNSPYVNVGNEWTKITYIWDLNVTFGSMRYDSLCDVNFMLENTDKNTVYYISDSSVVISPL